MNLLFGIGGYTFSAQVLWMKTRKDFVYGACNRTADGKYVVSLDYDKFRLSDIDSEIKSLQTEFDLGTFYVFQSSKNNYHAICLDKVDYKTFQKIMFNSSCDEDYQNVPVFYGKKLWVLRFTAKPNGKKPFLVGVVRRNSRKKQSNAHRIILHKFYNVWVPRYKMDKLKVCPVARYKV